MISTSTDVKDTPESAAEVRFREWYNDPERSEVVREVAKHFRPWIIYENKQVDKAHPLRLVYIWRFREDTKKKKVVLDCKTPKSMAAEIMDLPGFDQYQIFNVQPDDLIPTERVLQDYEK